MKKIRAHKLLQFFILVLIMHIALGMRSAAPQVPSKILIVISQKIKPYIDALNGIELFLKSTGVSYEVFYLDGPENPDLLSQEPSPARLYTLSVAIGPEAAVFLWERTSENPFPVLYTMILHPEKLSDAPKKLCGIPLSIPARIQITDIAHILPSLKRIGLLYDPAYNHHFYEESSKYALSLGVEIVPLKVSSKKEIPGALQKKWPHIDGLWLIPDRTVISESVVQYLIKEMLLKKIPVIGYNRFFYESGAAFNFIFDYEKLGRQTAAFAVDLLSGGPCGQKEPEYQVWLNQKALTKIGIPYWVDNSETLRVFP